MVDGFWTAALKKGGAAAIGAFLLYGLYKQVLGLPIFEKMTQEQTFLLIGGIVILVFIAFLAMRFFPDSKPKASGSKHEGHSQAFDLHRTWDNVNDIDCQELVGPDVSSATRAMGMTATSWSSGLVEKKIIVDNHFDDFETLYKELSNCEMIVPGFERRGLRCCDLITPEMTKAYLEMLEFKKGSNT